MKAFESINKGYDQIFKPNELSIGLVSPIENHGQRIAPTMKNHLERIQLVEALGFKGIWLRDIPFKVPSFGDAGQLFDPFTYLGYLAGLTKSITLGISSIALPLHHPANVAKSATTIDQLSSGRFVLGVASGDRPDEYPTMGIDFTKRGELFREAFEYIRHAHQDFPIIETTHYGAMKGNVDLLPKPVGHKIPMLMTGFSRQTLQWNVENTDGWMHYPRNLYHQQQTIAQWRQLIETTQEYGKPFMQPLYVDLHDNDDFQPQPIHLGFRIGAKYLVDYLEHLKSIGVNHLIFNLRFSSGNIEKTLEQLANKVLPHFHTTSKETIEL